VVRGSIVDYNRGSIVDYNLQVINRADLYLMDHEGKLYREIAGPISFIDDSAINKN